MHHLCHPEQREGSGSDIEMLRYTQQDSTPELLSHVSQGVILSNAKDLPQWAEMFRYAQHDKTRHHKIRFTLRLTIKLVVLSEVHSHPGQKNLNICSN